MDVAGKSFTDITFQADLLRPQLYSCPDRFGIAAQTTDVPYAVVSQGQLQEWTEHSHTDIPKSETSRDIILTSFEHL